MLTNYDNASNDVTFHWPENKIKYFSASCVSSNGSVWLERTRCRDTDRMSFPGVFSIV